MSTFVDVLTALDDWRHLPSYRLEPRVDAFAALYIRQFLESRLGLSFFPTIIPEFPLRRGTLWDESADSPNKSKKVDFALCQQDHDAVHFVEFKTDQASRTRNQDDYLEVAAAMTFGSILDGVRRIRDETKPEYRPKYDYLVEKLDEWGFALEKNSLERAMSTKVVRWYLQPKSTGDHEIGFKAFATFLAATDDELGPQLAPYFRKWIIGPASSAS